MSRGDDFRHALSPMLLVGLFNEPSRCSGYEEARREKTFLPPSTGETHMFQVLTCYQMGFLTKLSLGKRAEYLGDG